MIDSFILLLTLVGTKNNPPMFAGTNDVLVLKTSRAIFFWQDTPCFLVKISLDSVGRQGIYMCLAFIHVYSPF
jgi:hypothetical protein